jgi:hypothetical protein
MRMEGVGGRGVRVRGGEGGRGRKGNRESERTTPDPRPRLCVAGRWRQVATGRGDVCVDPDPTPLLCVHLDLVSGAMTRSVSSCLVSRPQVPVASTL